MTSGKRLIDEKGARLLDLGIVPSYHVQYDLLRDDRYTSWKKTFASERMHQQLWAEFREYTGRTPRIAIALHYGAWAWLLGWMLLGFTLERAFGTLAVVTCLVAGGARFVGVAVKWHDAALLRDWRRYRNLSN